MAIKVQRLISLDLATRIGLAFGNIGREPDYCASLLDSGGDDVGRFVQSFDAFLDRFVFDSRGMPRHCLLIYESPVLPPQTSFKTLRKLYLLPGFLEWRCHARGLPVREATPSQVKKFWTGKGNAKKPEMVATAQRWGYPVREDQQDEADALALWWFAVEQIAPHLVERKRQTLTPPA